MQFVNTWQTNTQLYKQISLPSKLKSIHKKPSFTIFVYLNVFFLRCIINQNSRTLRRGTKTLRIIKLYFKSNNPSPKITCLWNVNTLHLWHIKVSAFKCVQISNNSIFKIVLLHIFITLLGRKGLWSKTIIKGKQFYFIQFLLLFFIYFIYKCKWPFLLGPFLIISEFNVSLTRYIYKTTVTLHLLCFLRSSYVIL